MKPIKSVAAGCVLSLFLAISVQAGDMPGPGIKSTAPGSKSKKLETTICEPVAAGTGQKTSTCDEATLSPITEAMTIAIQLLTSVY